MLNTINIQKSIDNFIKESSNKKQEKTIIVFSKKAYKAIKKLFPNTNIQCIWFNINNK